MQMTDMTQFHKRIKRVLITEEEIGAAVAKTGDIISMEYKDKPLLLVSVLKGAYIFLADLSRAVNIPHEIGFMAAKSYFDGTESSGEVEIAMDLAQDISKYHVVIVEDIIDTGRTLKKLMDILASRKPLSLKMITLLDKPDRRVVDLQPDYALFTIPDRFVVGYGLDCGEYYRNLPCIAEYDEG